MGEAAFASRHWENAMQRAVSAGSIGLIGLAIIMHLVWAGVLSFDADAINATGPHALLLIARRPDIAAGVLFTVAVLAIVGCSIEERVPRIVLLLPQQVILWFSLIGAANAMWMGQFADGTVRSSGFLVVDQIPVVLVALGHTAALLWIARGEHGDGQR